VEHIDEEKWAGFGKWLRVHVDHAQSQLDEAKEKLASSTFLIEYLLQQFKQQCAYHSKPITRQSKTQGAHTIDHILSLQSMLEAQQENLQELINEGNDVIPQDSAGEAMLVEWQEKIHSTKMAISRLQSNIKKRMEGLKLGDRVAAQKLEQLKKDRWIAMQLNLHVLHEQLVWKLRARKFELATLDHTHST
jgi:ABC-type transporter Mla MlaB component